MSSSSLSDGGLLCAGRFDAYVSQRSATAYFLCVCVDRFDGYARDNSATKTDATCFSHSLYHFLIMAFSLCYTRVLSLTFLLFHTEVHYFIDLSIPIHPFIVVLVFPVDDVLPPVAVGQIPVDGLVDAVGKLRLRQPAQLVVDLGGVDGVAHIVALAVGDVGDQALRLAQLLADQPHDVDIPHLVVAADVVYLAHPSAADDEVDGLAVILHIQPVPDVQALAVHRQRLVVQRVGDHQRDQLLREVIRAVVVGAAAHRDRQAVGAVICQHQQVSAGLGAAVRAGGVDGRLLGEKQVGTVQRQVAVHLVGGHLVIPLDAVLPAGVQHDLRAQNIRLQKDLRVLNGAIHMALGGEIHHHVRMLLLEQVIDGLAVADVRLHEAEVGPTHDAFQRGQIAGVGQLVHADDTVLRMLVQHIENEVAADKPGAAGDNDGHKRKNNSITDIATCIASRYYKTLFFFNTCGQHGDTRF